MTIKIKHLFMIGITGLIAMPVVSTSAESEDLIKYRRGVMKAIGGHMSATSLIVRGKVPHKGQLKQHVNAMKMLTNDIPALFPEGSDFGETRAKEAVWEKPEDFGKAANKSNDSITNLLKAVEGGNDSEMLATFKKVGEGCKGCHKDFREKE
ncbi:MAG: cytochrome c [Gammaproteobacteria bacterium]|nr:cytochrome c [Gammaproteobacteria bacterium]